MFFAVRSFWFSSLAVRDSDRSRLLQKIGQSKGLSANSLNSHRWGTPVQQFALYSAPFGVIGAQ